MKRENGITLISLVVTIILITIIASVGISTGIDSINKAKVTKFNTELKIIHARVNELVEEMKLEELNKLGYSIPVNKQDKVNIALGGKSSTGFRYFNRTGLESIRIANIDREVLINFATKEVVDLEGIEDDGTKIYRLRDWQNTVHQDKNTEPPTFSLSKKVYGLNATIFVENIQYKGNVARGTISYCLLNGGEEGKWRQASGTEIPVTVSGNYKVRVTDAAGNKKDKTVEVVLANKPKLDTGMTPVVYDETAGKWKVAEENGGTWYDYASDKAMWANVMLQDGLVINQDGTIDDANMGSMFVWIPRYMYKIPAAYTDTNGVERGFHTSGAAEIGIKFLKGTTNIATDNTNEAMEDPYAESITIPTAQNNPWIVHPAFTDGSKTNYSHGGWDSEITGLWVAKFEASSSTPSAENGGGDTTSLSVRVLPNVPSWRNISVSNIFTVCQNMNNNGNVYGLSSKSDTHMMKNTEWGACAYLSKSIYGQEQVWNNPNNNYLTGYAAKANNSTDSDELTTENTNEYNTGNGPKASTTGNIYGIYDMAGGTWEYPAAYVETASTTSENSYMGNLVEVGKYADVYIIGTNNNSIENYNAIINSNNMITKWGDAIYETSSSGLESDSWQQDFSLFPAKNYPFLTRGGGFHYNVKEGIFCFNICDGNSTYDISFRPTLIVN